MRNYLQRKPEVLDSWIFSDSPRIVSVDFRTHGPEMLHKAVSIVQGRFLRFFCIHYWLCWNLTLGASLCLYISNFFLRKELLTRKLSLGLVVITLLILISGIINASSSTSNAKATAETARIAAGGGNSTAPWTAFLPQELRIKAGESVMWYNPTEVAAEPHTVTFVLDNSTMADVVSPLAVSNTTEFTAIPPGSNNEPVIIPGEGGMNTVLAINARTYNPVTIDSQDKVQFASPNANYSVTGDEKYINSGWLLPKGLEQVFPGSGNTFTLTFEKTGTYDYLCALHPWMVGSVVVEE